MKFCLVIITTLMLSACASADKVDASGTIYKVMPGHWTGESTTKYTAVEKASAPYIHDWCLSQDQVTISAKELAEALTGFVAETRGECSTGEIDDKPHVLRFEITCRLDGVDMAGEGVMIYAKDGKTTDMTLNLNSIAGEPPVTFSRIAHQKHLRSGSCPPEES